MVRNSHWLTVKKNTLELLCRRFLQFAGSLHFVLRVLLCFLSFSLFVCFLFFLWCNACCFYSFSAYPFLELGFSLLALNAISTELHAWAALLSVLTLSLSLTVFAVAQARQQRRQRQSRASGRMSHHSAPVCDVNGNGSFRTGPTVQLFNATTTPTWPKLS